MEAIRKTIILFAAFSTIFGCAILNASENDKMEKRLRERVDGVYQAYKERNFEKLLNFDVIDHDKKENRKRIDEMEKGYPILVDYKIKEVEITEDKAKVKVTITLMLNDKKDVSESFDYWVFKDNDWYLLDFGKIQ